MAQITVLSLCLLFSACFLRASLGSNQRPTPQTCGIDNQRFYCKVDRECKPRQQRCTNANVCVDPVSGREIGCNEHEGRNGAYDVILGRTPLSSSSSSKKRREEIGISDLEFKHHFIQYRGFTYEFGSTYPAQALDIADPTYKYGPGGEKVTSGNKLLYLGASIHVYAILE